MHADEYRLLFVFSWFVSGTHVRKSQRRRIIMSTEILRANETARETSLTVRYVYSGGSPLQRDSAKIPVRCIYSSRSSLTRSTLLSFAQRKFVSISFSFSQVTSRQTWQIDQINSTTMAELPEIRLAKLIQEGEREARWMHPIESIQIPFTRDRSTSRVHFSRLFCDSISQLRH